MKKNRIVASVLAVFLTVGGLFFAFPESKAVASSEIVTPAESDFIYKKLPVTNPTQINLLNYTGSDTKINIPETIEGLPVTKLMGNLFAENESVEYICIPKQVEVIVPTAFSLCSSLTAIDVHPESPYFASVDGVLFNKDITTLMAFPAGKGGSYTVPETVVSIGNRSFESCYNLTDVKMYNNVLTIGQQAFASCWNLSSIKLSDNLQTLGYRALAFCDSLTQIHLPASLKSIGAQALIGGIDSDSNWYYNFTNGVYYTPETESEEHVKALHVPSKYTIAEIRSITDIDTGIQILDPNGVLSLEGDLEFKATPVFNEAYQSLIPVRYSYANAYKLTLTQNGKAVTPKKDIVINFNSWSESPNPVATKLYEVSGNTLQQLHRKPYAPFVGTQTRALGTYILAENNDFSLRGDIDGDGIVSTYDTEIALSLAADLIKNITGEQLSAADVDGMAGITTDDARKILRFASGIEK